jgi:hypothetical protein
MKKQITQLVDDLDGSIIEHGGSTIKFALEGRQYEIDLSSSNAERLRSALAPFISAGRASSGGSRTTSRRPSRNASGELAAIRSWAQSHGYKVGDRGRISADVREAYERAH